MPSSRLPRFTRASGIPSIEITARDRTIVRLVHGHRFLRSSQLVTLLGGSSQQVIRRLQLLYHHGYLERPRAQLDYYHHGGSRHMVYGIGSKGAAILQDEIGNPMNVIRWSEKNRSVGRIYLDHALLVSDVMVAIELACRTNGEVRFVPKNQLPSPGHGPGENQGFKWNVNVNGQVKLGIMPDQVFALDYVTPNGETDRAFFFLEADRGTMPVMRHNLSQTSFYRKLLAYEATWTQSIHRNRFGFHRFRVLTITTVIGRLQSLIEACATLKAGHGLFLFADGTILDKPEKILTAVWQSVKHGEKASLIN